MLKKYIIKFCDQLILKEDRIKRYLDIFIIAFVGVTGAYLNWDILKNIAPAVLVAWFILNPIASKTYAKIALVFLVITPVLIILKLDSQAELVSIYAYYLLIMTVIYAVIESRQAKKDR